MRRNKKDQGPTWVTGTEDGQLRDFDPDEAIYGQRPPQNQPAQETARRQRRPHKGRPAPAFRMPPPEVKRGTFRWILLLIHAIPFAFVVFAYPEFELRYADVLYNNITWPLLSVWALLLIAHLVIVALLDVRESVVFTRRERRRRREYEAMRNQYQRQQIAQRVKRS